jgi:hypothetical protein
VLLGFELAAEWTYLSSVFPGIIRFISAWVDVRDIAKDIISSVGYKVLPSLSTMLPMFGYSSREFFFTSTSKDQERNYNTDITTEDAMASGALANADNATEDAVASCALAHALLFHDNQSKLVFFQKCNQIGHPRTRKKYETPSHWEGFSATIYTN